MRDLAKKDIVLHSTIFPKCIGPDMFSWIKHCVAEVCALPSALQVKSAFVVCSPSIPFLTSSGHTADTAREKAECLNSVFSSKSVSQTHHFLYPPYPVAPNCSWTLCPFLLTRWRACCQTSTQILPPVQMASALLS